MKKSSLLILLTCTAPLWGCVQNDPTLDEGAPAPHAGEVQANNIAAQVTNPAAPEAGQSQNMDGRHAALGQDRYEKGKVIEPAIAQIGDIGGSTSGGGSSQ